MFGICVFLCAFASCLCVFPCFACSLAFARFARLRMSPLLCVWQVTISKAVARNGHGGSDAFKGQREVLIDAIVPHTNAMGAVSTPMAPFIKLYKKVDVGGVS